MRGTARFGAGVAAVGVAGFWVGSLVAGHNAPDYSASQDYVSSLASRGSSVAWVAILAILASGVAHVGGALAQRRSWGGRVVPAALTAAALSLAAVAAFRQSCPEGAAGCSGPGGAPDDWLDSAHAAAVLAYQVSFVTALVAFGVLAWRRAGGRAGAGVPRLLGPMSWAVALASTGLLLRSLGEPDPGLWQRGWVAVGQVWLVATSILAAQRRLSASGREG